MSLRSRSKGVHQRSRGQCFRGKIHQATVLQYGSPIPGSIRSIFQGVAPKGASSLSADQRHSLASVTQRRHWSSAHDEENNAPTQRAKKARNAPHRRCLRAKRSTNLSLTHESVNPPTWTSPASVTTARFGLAICQLLRRDVMAFCSLHDRAIVPARQRQRRWKPSNNIVRKRMLRRARFLRENMTLAPLRRNANAETRCRPGEQRTRTGKRARAEGEGSKDSNKTSAPYIAAVRGLAKSCRVVVGQFRYKKCRSVRIHCCILLLQGHRPTNHSRETRSCPSPRSSCDDWPRTKCSDLEVPT